MSETQLTHGLLAHDARGGDGPRLPMWGRWVVAAIGMVASAVAGSLGIQLVTGLGLGAWLDADHTGLAPLGQVPVLILVYGSPTLAAVLLLWALSRVDRVRLRDYLGRTGSGVLRFLGHASAVAVPTTVACLALAALGADSDRSPASFSSSSNLVIIVVLVCSAVLVQGIPEELWFRGMAWVGAGRRPWATLAGTTLVFTVLHVVSQGGQNSVPERLWYLVLPLGMGFLAGCARWSTGSVWAAAGTHSGLHLGMIPVYVLAVPTGPWAWTTLGVLQLAAGAVLLRVHRPWRREAT